MNLRSGAIKTRAAARTIKPLRLAVAIIPGQSPRCRGKQALFPTLAPMSFKAIIKHRAC